MTDIYMSFEQLSPNQIFYNEKKEWVKCPSVMKWGNIFFNAFLNIEEDIRAGRQFSLSVRMFESDIIVLTDSDQEPISYEILCEGVESNDN